MASIDRAVRLCECASILVSDGLPTLVAARRFSEMLSRLVCKQLRLVVGPAAGGGDVTFVAPTSGPSPAAVCERVECVPRSNCERR